MAPPVTKSASSAPASQELPAHGKEAKLFKDILHLFETKKYKKGLRLCDNILKKYPEHGETIALKGLLLNSQSKKEDAYDHAKRGLAKNMKSRLCWHVYALIYRSDRHYHEAIKCYLNALKFEADNAKILPDLAILQVHVRDIAGFSKTRHTLLVNQPKHLSNWVSYSIALYLQKNYSECLRVLEALIKMRQEQEDTKGLEYSELLSFQIYVLVDSENYDDAWRVITSPSSAQILDGLFLKEQRASVSLKLNLLTEAITHYNELLLVNADNMAYHTGLHQAMQLSSSTSSMISLYLSLQRQHPKSILCRRLPLDLLNGSDFVAAADRYLRVGISKGIPSLFADVRPLYPSNKTVAISVSHSCSNEKSTAIVALVKSYCEALEQRKEWPSVVPYSIEADEMHAPHYYDNLPINDETLVYVYLFLAQHYDTCRDSTNAIFYINRAIALLPSLSDLYLFKGKFLKHSGNLLLAATYVDKARNLDLSDRYLNTKAAKYYLRCDNIAQAEKLVKLFARDGEKDGINNLLEMQCLWWEYRYGMALFRLKRYGRCLKMLKSSIDHFDTFEDDQFDFHSYCIRKYTLRAYINLLNFEDELRSSTRYTRAAISMIRCYLTLLQNELKEKQLAETAALDLANKLNSDANNDNDGDSSAERKREAKKEKLRLKREAMKLEAAAKSSTTSADSDSKKPQASAVGSKKPHEWDVDYHGETMTTINDKMLPIQKILKPLLKFAPKNTTVQLLAAEAALLRGKVLVCLKSLYAAARLNRDDPLVHFAICQFYFKDIQNLMSETSCDSTTNLIKKMITMEMSFLLLGKATVAECNKVYSERVSTLCCHLAVVKVAVMIDETSAATTDAMNTMVSMVEKETVESRRLDISHDVCRDIWLYLSSFASFSQQKECFFSACSVLFPWSSIFNSQLQDQRLNDALESLSI